jgi:hypothetical protein
MNSSITVNPQCPKREPNGEPLPEIDQQCRPQVPAHRLLYLLRHLDRRAFVPEQGEDLDEFPQKEIPGGEQQVEQEQHPCEAGDEGRRRAKKLRQEGGNRGRGRRGGWGTPRFGQRLGGLGDLFQGMPGRLELAGGGLEAGGHLAYPRPDRVRQHKAADGEPAKEPQHHEGRARHRGDPQPFQPADEGPEQGVEQQGQRNRNEELAPDVERSDPCECREHHDAD